eukprot:159694-Pleurochrysis_carterae.AAC.2
MRGRMRLLSPSLQSVDCRDWTRLRFLHDGPPVWSQFSGRRSPLRAHSLSPPPPPPPPLERPPPPSGSSRSCFSRPGAHLHLLSMTAEFTARPCMKFRQGALMAHKRHGRAFSTNGYV